MRMVAEPVRCIASGDSGLSLFGLSPWVLILFVDIRLFDLIFVFFGCLQGRAGTRLHHRLSLVLGLVVGLGRARAL